VQLVDGVLWGIRVVPAVHDRDSAVHVHDPHLVDLARTLDEESRVFAGNAESGEGALVAVAERGVIWGIEGDLSARDTRPL
jgi:hypothetical protein